MSDAWGPSASPPPPPDLGGHRSYPAAVERTRPGAFRDTVIVAGLAVAGVVGLVIWSGGDVSTGSEPDSSPPTLAVPSTGPGPSVTAVTAQTQAVNPSVPSASDPAAAAMVAGQDALIGVLPAPTGGTEQPAAGPGVRTWTFAGTDWETVRDAYVGTLRQQGFTVELQQSVNDGVTVGELFTLKDPTGTVSVQLAVGTANGQSGIEVTRQ